MFNLNATNVWTDPTVVQLKYNSFRIYIDELMKHISQADRVATDTENKSTEDISLIIDITQQFGEIYKDLVNFSPAITGVEVLEEYIDTKLGNNKKAVLVRLSYTETFDKPKLLHQLTTQFGVATR